MVKLHYFPLMENPNLFPVLHGGMNAPLWARSVIIFPGYILNLQDCSAAHLIISNWESFDMVS